MSTHLFGPHWRSMGEETRATPVGGVCNFCGDLIDVDDSGQMIGAVIMPEDGGEPVAGMQPAHAECLAVGIVGHMMGVCSCTGYAGTTTKRDAARELWRRLSDFHEDEDPA